MAFYRICFELVQMKWSTNTACIMAIPMSYALWVKGRVLKRILPEVSFLKAWCALLKKEVQAV